LNIEGKDHIVKMEQELLKVGDVINLDPTGKSYGPSGQILIGDSVITRIITEKEYENLTETELSEIYKGRRVITGENLSDSPAYKSRVEPDKIYFFEPKKN
jgi:hypothetical protein